MATIENILKNGIVGAGGAGFPTHIKLLAKPEFLIMNAAECEPLLHKDEELLLHHTEEVLKGFRIALELTGAKQGIIGIKKKHKQAVLQLSQKIDKNISICQIGDFYPAGDEVTLVQLTTGRIIQPGELPISAGCVVQNVETLFNIGRNKPVIEKYITVAGAVETPLTFKAPIGVTFAEVLSKFNFTARSFAVRSGGLMMGKLEKDLNEVITKATGGLLILPSDHYCVTKYEQFSVPHNTVRIAKAACDQCNYCTELCPRYLLGYPVRPETAMRNRMFSREEDTVAYKGNAFCCECNLCTLYSCPEGLDPKGCTFIEKVIAASQEDKWEGLPVSAHPMMEYRKVPTKKLMQRLDVLKFKDEAVLTDIDLNPKQVRIPLNQHIGAPAKPVVDAGQKISKYDLIAASVGKISSNIHASIDGTVANVNDKEIIIKR